MSTFKILYTRDEAAEVLSMAPNRVDHLREAGKLVARRDGMAYRYHIDDLAAFADGLPEWSTK